LAATAGLLKCEPSAEGKRQLDLNPVKLDAEIRPREGIRLHAVRLGLAGAPERLVDCGPADPIASPHFAGLTPGIPAAIVQRKARKKREGEREQLCWFQ
jgi:hypothetical protein